MLEANLTFDYLLGEVNPADIWHGIGVVTKPWQEFNLMVNSYHFMYKCLKHTYIRIVIINFELHLEGVLQNIFICYFLLFGCDCNAWQLLCERVLLQHQIAGKELVRTGGILGL